MQYSTYFKITMSITLSQYFFYRKNHLPTTILRMPIEYTNYMSVALLASLDSVFGGLRAGSEEQFDNLIFMTGFFTNALSAAGLICIGELIILIYTMQPFWHLALGSFKIRPSFTTIF
ncbi:MAG: hypothetical protein H6Q68_210 [Firmicutes bacterium]|nr:hypothetical protein [Bacillota bacterium]